jgi:hypothetical protein
MTRKTILVLGLAVIGFGSGCMTHKPKPCQVERICFRYREDMLDCLTNHTSMMKDILKTIATLEQEAGGYQ